jgi:adenosylcobinamide-phosphate synthase
MSFFSILIALLLEQIHPLGRQHPLRLWITGLVVAIRKNFDAGKPSQAALIWCLIVVAPALAVVLVQWGLDQLLGWPFVVAWNILVLHLTLGFRQFSFHLTGIRKALDEGNEGKARELLATWRDLDTRDFSRGQIYLRVMQASTLATHRTVFGVFFWFAVLASLGLGPAGAIMYRFADLGYRLSQRSGAQDAQASLPVRDLFTRAWAWIDWVPVRMTAISFAMVGNFEEVVDKWRSQPPGNPHDPVGTNEALLLATAFAAVNLATADTPITGSGSDQTTDFGVSEPFADTQIRSRSNKPSRPKESALSMLELNQMVGLMWRALLLWMLTLALLSAANVMG